MIRIRKITIENFRAIKSLDWLPAKGINCLIGAGDSGKSTILDAIDWCLGARRSLPVTDADFNNLNVDDLIQIDITIGNLTDRLKGLDSYGLYLRGFNEQDGSIEDEPSETLETVLTARLAIGSDLEPHWTLVSERAESQGASRYLSWGDRVNIAPIRIGAYASYHLSWQKGSILTHVTEEKVEASAALADAARQARQAFGDSAGDQLDETLDIVARTADNLGIDYGENIKALLDAHSVSFSGGTISLHDDQGVPLKKLGLGSSRLLVAGLQNRVANVSSIALVDELEHGLEPHRITRLLYTLGAKDNSPPLQVFMTTHSPVVLRELRSNQLQIVRGTPVKHDIINPGSNDAVQGTLRRSAEAFLGANVIICEGATEVGLLRGLDRHRNDMGKKSFMATGGVTVDAGGVGNIYRVAKSFVELDFRASVLRDDDRQPNEQDESWFELIAGPVFKWSKGLATEDMIFNCVTDEAVADLIQYAIDSHGQELIAAHLTSAANKAIDLDIWSATTTDKKRRITAKAAKTGSWFKRIDLMEDAAYNIIGPGLI